jgi:hypothetical protein
MSITVVVPVRGLHIVQRNNVEIGRYTGDWGLGFTARETPGTLELGHYPTDHQAQEAIVAMNDAKEFLAALPVASVQVDVE